MKSNEFLENVAEEVFGSDASSGTPSSILGHACSQFTFHCTDGGSGANKNGSFWVPDYDRLGPKANGYYFFGNYAVSGTSDVPPGSQMLYKAVNDTTDDPCFAAPIGFTRIWSRSHTDLIVYAIQAPFGYIALGCIVTVNNQPPSATSVAHFDKLMCVREDLCSKITVTRANNLVWDDKGSGAQACVSVFLLPTSQTAVGIVDYPDSVDVWDIKKSS